MIDTHCHLYPEFGFVTKTPEEIVEECIKNGVTQMWLAATEKADILWNLEFCIKYPKNIKTWVGWHPEQYKSFDEHFLSDLLEKNSKSQNLNSPTLTNFDLGHPGGSETTDRIYNLDSSALPQNDNEEANTKYQILDTIFSPIVGIGEVGLDFAAHPKSTKEDQVKVFESQLKLAQKYNLPVAIHCRDAFEEMIEVMTKYKDIKYLWHCFNLSKEKTEIIFKEFSNIYVGINAIFTYKSGEYIKESLKIIPQNKLLIETDAPFLAPRPFKYSFNTPLGVKEVYSALSEYLGIDSTKLEVLIRENSLNF